MSGSNDVMVLGRLVNEIEMLAKAAPSAFRSQFGEHFRACMLSYRTWPPRVFTFAGLPSRK